MLKVKVSTSGCWWCFYLPWKCHTTRRTFLIDVYNYFTRSKRPTFISVLTRHFHSREPNLTTKKICEYLYMLHLIFLFIFSLQLETQAWQNSIKCNSFRLKRTYLSYPVCFCSTFFVPECFDLKLAWTHDKQEFSSSFRFWVPAVIALK